MLNIWKILVVSVFIIFSFCVSFLLGLILLLISYILLYRIIKFKIPNQNTELNNYILVFKIFNLRFYKYNKIFLIGNCQIENNQKYVIKNILTFNNYKLLLLQY